MIGLEPGIVVKFPQGTSVRGGGGVVNNEVLALNVAEAVRNREPVALPSECDENGKPLWEIIRIPAPDCGPVLPVLVGALLVLAGIAVGFACR